MTLFFPLLLKLIPLYVSMGLGYIAGKYLNVQRETIGALLLYIFIPVVYFAAVATTPLTASTLSLPLLFFALCSLMCLLFLFIGGHIWKDETKNICAQAAGGGNYAYFAIPVASAIFGQQAVGLIVLCGLGFVFYENTVGFFVAARGHHSAQESLLKLVKLPALWATIGAFLVNISHIRLPLVFLDAAANFRGGFTVLGMMLVGLGLANLNIQEHKFEYAYIAVTFFARFIIWPLLMILIIFLDTLFFHFYSNSLYKIMTLMSIIPLSANTIVYAISLKIEPEKVALGVLLSTLFALVFVPFIVINYIH
jgi:predicted permease